MLQGSSFQQGEALEPINLVVVLSSDRHILRGARFLRENCDYSNLREVDIRHARSFVC